MKAISSKSKLKVLRFLTPPTGETGIDEVAPIGLTVRKLIHHKAFRKRRERATFIRVEGDHLLCIQNLVRFGQDWCG